MTNYHRLACAAAIAILMSSAAKAADVSPLATPEPAPTSEAEDWSFAASPYFWGASLSGKTSQFGVPTVKLDSTFSDILENLHFAFMAAAELRYNRFSVIGDFQYIKLSADAATPLGLLTKEVDVQAETVAGLLGVGYAVLESDRGHLDVVGGIKVWSVDTTISFNGGFLDGRSRSDMGRWHGRRARQV